MIPPRRDLTSGTVLERADTKDFSDTNEVSDQIADNIPHIPDHCG